MSQRKTRRLVLVGLLQALAASCHREHGPAPKAGRRDLSVFAAASLREAFTELASHFEALHPEAHVVTSFAGSQTLRGQIEHGAPADLFASADERHLGALVAEGHVKEPHLFARNELVVVVARRDGESIREFGQLPNAERIVLGAPEVPIGAYTRQVLERATAELGADFPARVEARVVSREPDVRQVLAKVARGEADAGVVYRTDARTVEDKVLVVNIPPAYNITAKYPAALATHGREPELARAFLALLLSPEGARTLAALGFLPPNGPSADVH